MKTRRIVVVEVEFEPVRRDQARVPRVAYVPLTAVSMLSAVDLPDGRRAWRLTVHGHEVPEPITDASGVRLRRALQDTTLETLRALEARLRQLFADLGFPADEAVELRADELAAVLDVAEVERERDEAVSRSERVSSFAATLIGNACERHSAEIAVMGFHEFQQVQPKSCHWCCEAERDRLAAEVDRLRATLAEAPTPAREEGQ